MMLFICLDIEDKAKVFFVNNGLHQIVNWHGVKQMEVLKNLCPFQTVTWFFQQVPLDVCFTSDTTVIPVQPFGASFYLNRHLFILLEIGICILGTMWRRWLELGRKSRKQKSQQFFNSGISNCNSEAIRKKVVKDPVLLFIYEFLSFAWFLCKTWIRLTLNTWKYSWDHEKCYNGLVGKPFKRKVKIIVILYCRYGY